MMSQTNKTSIYMPGPGTGSSMRETPIPARIVAPRIKHTHTVIFLHGPGDRVKDFINSLNSWRDSQDQTLADRFPSFRWVLPQAEPADVSQPHWFETFGMADMAGVPDQEELSGPGLRASIRRLRGLIDNEARFLGRNYKKVILAGLSQGGAMAAHVLLSMPSGQTLGGFLGISCRLPFGHQSLPTLRATVNAVNRAQDGDDEVIRGTPIQLQHCDDDIHVGVQYGARMRESLVSYGGRVDWKAYPNGGHWFNSPNGANDAIRFLSSVLGVWPMGVPVMVAAQPDPLMDLLMSE